MAQQIRHFGIVFMYFLPLTCYFSFSSLHFDLVCYIPHLQPLADSVYCRYIR